VQGSLCDKTQLCAKGELFTATEDGTYVQE